MIILNSQNKKDNQNDIVQNMSVVNNDNDKKNKTNTNIQSGSNQPNLSLTTPLSKDLKKYESNESDK